MTGFVANRICGLIGRHHVARSSAPLLLGLLPPFLTRFWLEAGLIAGRFVLLFIVVLGWQLAFRRLRGQAFGPEGLASAMLLAILTPSDAPSWQLALGASFGIVLGELIFGGRGRSFVHPVAVALAFLMFSFTDAAYRAGPQIPLWTLAPAFILLLLSGQAAWRVLLTAAGAIVIVSWSLGAAQPWNSLMNGALAAALLFLAADPVASAATNAGRAIYGALAGILAVLFALGGEAFGAAVFAILLASIFAPLIDHCAIGIHERLRRRRHA